MLQLLHIQLRSSSFQLFRNVRGVFFAGGDAPKASVDKAEAPTERPEKSLGDLKKEAESALQDAQDEMQNIEKQYKLPKDSTDAQLQKVKMPEKVLAAYKLLRESAVNLRKFMKAGEAKQREQQAVIETTLTNIDSAFAGIQPGEEISNHDPLAGFEDRFYPMHSERTKVIFDAPAAPSDHEVEEADPQLMAANIMDKLYNGGDFSKPEAETLSRLFGDKNRVEGKGPNGADYILDLSTDKKSVRIQMTEVPKDVRGSGQAPGIKEFTSVRVQPLDAKNAGTKQFNGPSEIEKQQKQLEGNRDEYKKDLAWLQTDKAPVGSMIFLSNEEITRRNFDTQKDEKFIDSLVVKKAADGKLYAVTLEAPVGADGVVDTTKVKETKSTLFDAKNIDVSIVSPRFKPSQVEANTEMQTAEVRRYLDQVAGNLARSSIFGTNSELYKDSYNKLNAALQKNAALVPAGWSYTWKETGVTVSYDTANKTLAVQQSTPKRDVPPKAPDNRYASN